MKFPTITEKYGTFICRVPPLDPHWRVRPTSPLFSGVSGEDPGWFSPEFLSPAAQAPDNNVTK